MGKAAMAQLPPRFWLFLSNRLSVALVYNAAQVEGGDYVDLKEELKAYAQSIGVARLGVTTAEPFTELRQILERRKQAGKMTSFENPDLDVRCDPRLVLPDARSLISIAVPYYVEPPFPVAPAKTNRLGNKSPSSNDIGKRAINQRPIRGWISRHAWGRDYHSIVGEKMEAIIAWLKQRVPDSETVAYVDTGPTVDRAVAERAGVGWIGKNCSVIVPGVGSWVVLGTLITTIDLPPDDPAVPPGTECADCDICLRACPTGALEDPYQLDPFRCLSYVTQMKGIVPEPFRAALGNRLYGCDTCQQVCPKNRDLLALGDPGFVPSSQWETSPDLEEMLALGKRRFNELYANRASAWRGRKILQRNAVIALGNSGNPEAIDRLMRILQHDVRYELRAMAAWSLGQIGERLDSASGTKEKLRSALEVALTTEEHPQVIREIHAALDKLIASHSVS